MPRRLLCFVAKRRGISPGQRFRLEQWEPHLAAEHGIHLDFCAFESERLTDVMYQRGHHAEKAAWLVWDFLRRANAVRRARDYDAAVVYREAANIGPAFYERILAREGVPFVLDFDDAIFEPSPTGGRVHVNRHFSWLRFPGKTRAIAKLAAAVTVGNGYLADWARQYNDNVHVVPTAIELATYTPQPELESEEPFVIGWMGSFSTLAYLELVRGAIERFGRTRRVRFVVVCDRPLEPPVAGVETVFVPWRGDREAADIGTMHVGIMPLPDDPFSRGKCACKALQYMAAARATVISPVGVNADIVHDGENGLFARTEDEWVAAFEKLAASRDLRRRLVSAGRMTVEQGFTAEISAARFAAAVESMFDAGVPSRTSSTAATRHSVRTGILPQ